MKVASFLGLSLGWALTALAASLSVGMEDPLFWPSLAITLPALVGMFGAARAQRQKKEVLSVVRVAAFGVLGALIATAAVLALIAGLFWNKPVPGSPESERAHPGVVVDDQIVID
ncbi:MAG: hypothetical protein JNM17_16585 [Archangium sp.]|nr:hypothetical protein [Archangium sp.]